jgi:copper oxidase (laccase) domain-containing protein
VEYLVEGGSRKEDIFAAVGPGIGPCCYTVGQDVADEFQDRRLYPEVVLQASGPGKFILDLELANLWQLRHCSIPENQLGKAGFCTACRNEDFYSYRKEHGHTGRHAAMMVLL